MGAKSSRRERGERADSRHLGRGAPRHVGIRQVAEAAGVSVASVSRTLNKPDAVSKAMLQRVQAAIDRLSYVPNSAARSLSLQRTHTIGAIVPTLDYSIFARFVEALQDKAGRSGYSIVLSICGFGADFQERELEQARALIAHGIDALIVAGEHHRQELYRLLETRGVAYVHTSVYNPDSQHPCVGYDNKGAARQVVAHLLSLGHRQIGALVGSQVTNDRMARRIDGARAALAARGLELPDSRIVERPYSVVRAREGFRELLSKAAGLTAVMCGNDVLAFGALLEAQAMGLEVPRDLSVVGFDNLEWASEIVPALTTVRVPTYDMGTATADYLVGRLTGTATARHTKIDVDLILRGSTGPCPSA